VALGDTAGAAITTGGDNNVFVGADAAPVNTTGNNQVYVGRGAGYVNTSGTSNSGIGWSGFSWKHNWRV
jgi:trimeric autotransporter adhesin